MPGPGLYDPGMGIDKEGKYFLSTVSNSKASRISPSRRFLELKKDIAPGPGQYDPIDYLDSSGSYFFSKYKNSGVRRFGK